MAPIISSWHPVRVYRISKQSYVNAIITGSDFSFNAYSIFRLRVRVLMVESKQLQLRDTGSTRADE